MKKQILRDLFNGQICPWEKRPDPKSKRGRQSAQVTAKADALRRLLDKEQLAAFNDYTAEHHYYTHLSEDDGFVDGFCLGIKILIAALDLPEEMDEEPLDVTDNDDI